MSKSTLIRQARIVNEGTTFEGDVLIEGERIAAIDKHLSPKNGNTRVIDAHGHFLIPGVIDDQVHFREPGLTHKGDIQSESRAAVMGGTTTYIEQPNTNPPALTLEELEKKYARAAQVSAANYSFSLGASNSNLEEILRADLRTISGVKVFMGSSTGNLLVDNHDALEKLFAQSPHMIITHCEDEATIRRNMEEAKAQFGDDIPMAWHPRIRSEEACFLSSSFAVDLAKKHNSRLHIYHISTDKETHLFSNELPLVKKRITAEACIHHLWFNDEDYDSKGSLIKWNPSVKKESDRLGIWQALKEGRIDVVATDHAPHTLEEKQKPYAQAPSGGPLVQHSLVAMMEFVKDGDITMEQLVQWMCHNPATLFRIEDRGYLREGYYADLVLVDPSRPWTVTKENIAYHCGWSPFEGTTFKARVTHTFVNGHLAYEKGKGVDDSIKGKRLLFDRKDW